MTSGGFIFVCIMAFLYLIYSLSSAAKYYIKLAILMVTSFFWASLPIPFMLFRPFDARNGLIPSWFAQKTANLVGISWEVRGVENVDDSRGAVVVLNHQSMLELLVCALLWPKMQNGTVVVKSSVFWLWPFGLGAWLWGTIFINKSKTKEAKSSLAIQADAVRDRKAKLFLFPEGTRHVGNELLPFKKGAFHCSLQAKAPIQPVVISKYHFLDHEKRRFNSGHFVVSILPLIETSDYNADNIDDLVKVTRDIMQTTFTDLSAEMLLLNTKQQYDKIKSN